MTTTVVLGAGMMGSAIAVPIADRGHEVRLVGSHLDEQVIDRLRVDGVHPDMDLELPSSIAFHQLDELEQAMDGAEVLVLGVSSAGVRWAGEQTAPFVRADLPVLSITKGIEFDGERLRILPDVLAESWPEAAREAVQPGAVVGPCIAGELVRRVPTSVVFTSRDADVVERLAEQFHTGYYHVRSSTDVVGLEVTAAMKNAYAMAIGFAAGLNEAAGNDPGSVAMHNHAAAVFAQASLEMRRIVELVGGETSLTAGLPGVGDLYVTCQGGRTSRLGRHLGLGKSLPEAIEAMDGATLEALEVIEVWSEALPVLTERGELRGDELPLLRHLSAMVSAGAELDVPFEAFYRDFAAPGVGAGV